MDTLLPAFRRQLRAHAHALHPVVSIGHHGLTPPVLHEIDVALTAHELIKVRVASDERDERDALLERICAQLDCAPVQQIGKLFVLWRRRPAAATAKPARVRKGRAARTAQGAEPRSPARPQAGQTRRRRVSAPTPVEAAPHARRKAPPGKAPPGVPRAAAPRRRRTSG